MDDHETFAIRFAWGQKIRSRHPDDPAIMIPMVFPSRTLALVTVAFHREWGGR